MKFTIAIPTYNNGRTLSAAIESALEQDYAFDYEVLVVNNFSSDNTGDVLNSINDQKLRIIHNLSTVSLFENHNVCLVNAKGDYVLFCHADDLLLTHALSILNELTTRRELPTHYVAWGRSLFRDYYNNWQSGGGQLNTVLSGMTSISPFINGGLTPSGTCYSRKSFIECGGFLPMVTNITPSDMSTMFKLALNGFEFEMIDRILFKRKFASTATGFTSKEGRRSYQDAIYILQKDLGEQFNTLVEWIRMTANYNVILYYSVAKISDGRTIRQLMLSLLSRFLRNPIRVMNRLRRFVLTFK